MRDFSREVLRRLPLAEAVWTVLRFVADERVLETLFEKHRGTGSTQAITFGTLVELVTEALLIHQGSGRKSFEQARRDGRLEASVAALYGKLRRLPAALSEAFLATMTQRVRELLPPERASAVPASLARFRVLVVDGKKIKRLAKRLKPLRAFGGRLLGCKAVAGLLLNEGLITAMHVSLDGEANDAPLAPGLFEQARGMSPEPHLIVADRQFCDLKIPRLILDHGNAFVIRFTRKMTFFVEREETFLDAQGRSVRQEWGWLGRPVKRRLYVRRITLDRGVEEPVSIVTSLLEPSEVSAEDVLAVYLARWSIERVFQQITEVFQLDRLISSSPQGAAFQFALCALLYNVIQVVRLHVAASQARPAETISTENLFYDARRQMSASLLLTGGIPLEEILPPAGTAHDTRARLRELLAACWSPLWIKSPPKKKTLPTKKQAIRGGHASAWKLLQLATQKHLC